MFHTVKGGSKGRKPHAAKKLGAPPVVLWRPMPVSLPLPIVSPSTALITLPRRLRLRKRLGLALNLEWNIVMWNVSWQLCSLFVEDMQAVLCDGVFQPWNDFSNDPPRRYPYSVRNSPPVRWGLLDFYVDYIDFMFFRFFVLVFIKS